MRGCEIVEIKDNLKRNFFRDSFYLIIGKIVPIEPLHLDLEKFERVFILAQIWAGNIPFPMRSFLFKNKDALINKEVVFVSSSGFGERNKSFVIKLNKIPGNLVKKALFIKENNVSSGRYKEYLENFLNSL
ncbi:hypothetical protein [Caldisericum sp. AR60]|uniref:hypothetical protein n=1 Tax=Caldisericum sp. AR60 TaxID=3397852 RepID=UPI0039FC8383